MTRRLRRTWEDFYINDMAQSGASGDDLAFTETGDVIMEEHVLPRVPSMIGDAPSPHPGVNLQLGSGHFAEGEGDRDYTPEDLGGDSSLPMGFGDEDAQVEHIIDIDIPGANHTETAEGDINIGSAARCTHSVMEDDSRAVYSVSDTSVANSGTRDSEVFYENSDITELVDAMPRADETNDTEDMLNLPVGNTSSRTQEFSDESGINNDTTMIVNKSQRIKQSEAFIGDNGVDDNMSNLAIVDITSQASEPIDTQQTIDGNENEYESDREPTNSRPPEPEPDHCHSDNSQICHDVFGDVVNHDVHNHRVISSGRGIDVSDDVNTPTDRLSSFPGVEGDLSPSDETYSDSDFDSDDSDDESADKIVNSVNAAGPLINMVKRIKLAKSLSTMVLVGSPPQSVQKRLSTVMEGQTKVYPQEPRGKSGNPRKMAATNNRAILPPIKTKSSKAPVRINADVTSKVQPERDHDPKSSTDNNECRFESKVGIRLVDNAHRKRIIHTGNSRLNDDTVGKYGGVTILPSTARIQSGHLSLTVKVPPDALPPISNMYKLPSNLTRIADEDDGKNIADQNPLSVEITVVREELLDKCAKTKKLSPYSVHNIMGKTNKTHPFLRQHRSYNICPAQSVNYMDRDIINTRAQWPAFNTGYPPMQSTRKREADLTPRSTRTPRSSQSLGPRQLGKALK